MGGKNCLFSATLLVFLLAAAGTGIIAPHLRPGPFGLWLFLGKVVGGLAHNVARLCLVRLGRILECAGGGVRRLLRHVAQKILERPQARSAPEDVVANLGFDVDHQFFKDLERLRLVFDERIALAVGS